MDRLVDSVRDFVAVRVDRLLCAHWRWDCPPGGSGRSGGQAFGYNGSNLERLIQGRVAEIRRLPPDSKELCAQALLRERPDFFMPRKVGGQTPQPPDQQTLELAALGIANAMSE